MDLYILYIVEKEDLELYLVMNLLEAFLFFIYNLQACQEKTRSKICDFSN